MRSSHKVNYNSLSYIRGRYGVNSEEYRKARAEKMDAQGASERPRIEEPKPVESDLTQFDLAEVVTDLAKEKTKPSQDIKPLPGESPLEFARRRKKILNQ